MANRRETRHPCAVRRIRCRRESGFALITTLMILVMLTLLAISMYRHSSTRTLVQRVHAISA